MYWLVVAAIVLPGCAQPAGERPPPSPRRGTGAVGAEVGVLQTVQGARDTLMSPNARFLVVSARCGFGNAPPAGWFAVRYLVAAGRVDFLLAAYREAPTSEGRIWAAYGLVENGRLARAGLDELVRSLGGPAWTCEGCFLRQSTPEEALGHLYPLD